MMLKLPVQVRLMSMQELNLCMDIAELCSNVTLQLQIPC